jgi:hypothetical protein
VLSEINKLKVQKWKEEEYSKLQSDPKSNEHDSDDEIENDTLRSEEKKSETDSDPGKHFQPEPEIPLKDIPMLDEIEDDEKIINNPLSSGSKDSLAN